MNYTYLQGFQLHDLFDKRGSCKVYDYYHGVSWGTGSLKNKVYQNLSITWLWHENSWWICIRVYIYQNGNKREREYVPYSELNISHNQSGILQGSHIKQRLIFPSRQGFFLICSQIDVTYTHGNLKTTQLKSGKFIWTKPPFLRSKC